MKLLERLIDKSSDFDINNNSETKIRKKKLAALSMLHKAKKAYYACNRVAARTGCAVHAPCLLAVRQLP